MLLALVVYFSLRSYIAWTIPGIGLDIRTIVLIAIIGISMYSLMKGAYRAYHGVAADEVNVKHIDTIK
jgi:hypothetical protein